MMRALGHERNDTIDVFRAFAILSVAAYHYSTIEVVRSCLNVTLLRWLELGRFGVHVFFIISGAVIAMTLTRSKGLVEFAVKRAARIYPAYFVAMLMTVMCSRLLHLGSWVGKLQVLENLLPYGFGQAFIDPSYWSLTYELQFYSLVGLAYAAIGARAWLVVAVVVIAGAIVSVAAPQAAQAHALLIYLPLFLAGIAAWQLAADGNPAGWLALVLAVAAYPFTSPLYETRSHIYLPWMMHLYVLGLGGVLVALLISRFNLRLPALAAVGRWSYSLYLVHQVIGIALIQQLVMAGVPPLAAVVAVLVLMVAIARLMFRYVEEPGRAILLRGWRRSSARLREAMI